MATNKSASKKAAKKRTTKHETRTAERPPKHFTACTLKMGGSKGVKLEWTIACPESGNNEKGAKEPPQPPLESFVVAFQAFGALCSKMCDSLKVAKPETVTVRKIKWTDHQDFGEMLWCTFKIPRKSSLNELEIEASYPIGQSETGAKVKLSKETIEKLAALSADLRAEMRKYDEGARGITRELPLEDDDTDEDNETGEMSFD